MMRCVGEDGERGVVVAVPAAHVEEDRPAAGVVAERGIGAVDLDAAPLRRHRADAYGELPLAKDAVLESLRVGAPSEKG